jgi:hypothetical protein
VGLLYERAGRLTALFDGFRPGQAVSKEVAGCLPEPMDPHLNYTCMLITTPNDDDQDCVLRHQLTKPDIMDAVDDPQACHSTWTWLYLLVRADGRPPAVGRPCAG